MSTPAAPTLLLLYSDRDDPVSAALLARPEHFGADVVAIPLGELVRDVTIGATWRWAGRTIDPARTAVVNRLFLPAAAASPFAGYAQERRFWGWAHGELQRFAYATSLPTATSLHGCHGSLLDQWLDLPALVDGLPVPSYRAPWSDEPLSGDVHRVDPWTLYSLGVRERDPREAARGLLRFVRPRGALVHVAQVGGTILASSPAQMTRAQQSSIVSFANAMASRSAVRILEHAFFIGDGPPVFYSTCPSPVITGSLPEYPALLAKGLQDDIARRFANLAAGPRPAG